MEQGVLSPAFGCPAAHGATSTASGPSGGALVRMLMVSVLVVFSFLALSRPTATAGRLCNFRGSGLLLRRSARRRVLFPASDAWGCPTPTVPDGPLRRVDWPYLSADW